MQREIAELRRLLPQRIERLADIAYDLWWASNHSARVIFRELSRHEWWRFEHNPITVIKRLPRQRFDELAANEQFLRDYDMALAEYDISCTRSTKWFETEKRIFDTPPIAYFSAEYGLHSSLPIYSGGLGILAGDHIKSADDLGVPIVAIGFLYPYGYFEQHISSYGDQLSTYQQLDFASTALTEVTIDGKPLIISIPLDPEERDLHLKIWKVQVGTVSIYLMDSDLDTNPAEYSDLTRRLYGGDKLYRLRQEIALGVGGVKILNALGITPSVWHANEGHSAFSFIERLRQQRLEGKSFEEALAHIRSTSIFTTHTPVPAGHDSFDESIVAGYFRQTIESLAISSDQFLQLGRHEGGFNMTALAMTMSGKRNAVSIRHREVTEEMWKDYETPSNRIQSVTNGVHTATWMAPEFEDFFTLGLDGNWRQHLADAPYWKQVHNLPDHLLWHVRMELARHLGRYIVDLLRKHYHHNADDMIVRGALYNPSAMTIGFARRFATYKRSLLLFKDPDRLAKLLNDPSRPVQIIFSGKAHPADEPGKAMIKEIWKFACDPMFRGKIIFLEDYSMHMAKMLVQGVDLWMNLPRAPLEASGTSGMKAAINGVPNLSVLDGWWCEAYNGQNGWAIGSNDTLSESEQDEADAERLYQLLETEIVPLYFKRDLNDIPTDWLKVAKESIASVLPNFSGERMMREYVETLYLPLIK